MAKTFEIKKVKWSWPKTVKSPGVYRDDEFIETSSKKSALEAIDFLLNKPQGMTYTITVKRDRRYYTYYRHSMPCLGGLVKYRDSHGSDYFMNPYFPRDIRVAFPEGDIIYIGYYRAGTANIFNNELNKFLFSSESPWVSAYGDKSTIIFKDNYFVLTNMDTDPTVFYSLLRLGGLRYNGSSGVYSAQQNNWHPKAFLLINKTAQADPRRLAGQKPWRISGGTWAEGYGYTRPYNESIFKTVLPTKFKDFGSLSGYPNAPYENTYFITTMKEKFGVTNFSSYSKETEDKLIEAWDYFKEASKELDDQP